jgi:hypothetical protein
MWDDVRMGLRSGILFAVAMTVAAFTAVGSDIPPIVPALAASLTIAVLGCALRLVSPF